MSGLGRALTVFGALAPLAPALVWGCGGTSTVSVASTSAADGGAGYVTVVTGGGGVQSAASPTGSGDPFDTPPSTGSSGSAPSSGSGSTGSGAASGSSGAASASGASTGSSGASSGTSSGTSSGSSGVGGGGASSGSGASAGSGSSSGTSSGGGTSGSSSGSSSSGGAPYTPPVCGSQTGAPACDLHSNTCCLTTTLYGTCVAGANASCPSNSAAIHCLEGSECGGGLSCCGDIVTLLGQVRSSCVNVPSGGKCPYVPWTATQLGVQLCSTDAECRNGQPCVQQTCIYGAVLSMCGLQSASPLNCH